MEVSKENQLFDYRQILKRYFNGESKQKLSVDILPELKQI